MGGNGKEVASHFVMWAIIGIDVCCRPPSPCPGHPDREACARKWPCALRRAVCELWQGRRGGIGRTRSRDGMAAPLSSKERVSQLVHGERRGEKGGVAGDPLPF